MPRWTRSSFPIVVYFSHPDIFLTAEINVQVNRVTLFCSPFLISSLICDIKMLRKDIILEELVFFMAHIQDFKIFLLLLLQRVTATFDSEKIYFNEKRNTPVSVSDRKTMAILATLSSLNSCKYFHSVYIINKKPLHRFTIHFGW